MNLAAAEAPLLREAKPKRRPLSRATREGASSARAIGTVRLKAVPSSANHRPHLTAMEVSIAKKDEESSARSTLPNSCDDGRRTRTHSHTSRNTHTSGLRAAPQHVQHVRPRAREPSGRGHGAPLRLQAVRWRQGGDGPVAHCADACVPEPPYCTYGLRVPASCRATYLRHRAAAAPRYVHRTHIRLGRAVRTAYRGPPGTRGRTWCAGTTRAAAGLSWTAWCST